MVEVVPHLMVKTGDIAKYVLLSGDPGRVKQISEQLQDAKKVSEYRGFVSYTGTYKGIPVSAVSTGIGCPSACIVVEELARVGAKVFIRVGTTGSLQPHIDIGDIIIATSATRTDGATKSYVPVEYPAVASFKVVHALMKAAEDLGIKFYLGPVYTSDAFYAEDPEFAKKWGKMGILSVEMECSGIFVLASLKGLEAGAILAVDGNLIKGTKKGAFKQGEEVGELHPKVREAIRSEIKVALEAIRILEGQ